MSKYSRHQSVISRNTDEHISEDHWLKQFQKTLEKGAVQPAQHSLYDQITNIMNTKSKYPSVQAAVDDMMQRSGLTDYLHGVKVSSEEGGKAKTAADQNDAFLKEIPVEEKVSEEESEPEHKHEHCEHDHEKSLPIVIIKHPSIGRTLENYIKATRGNLPVPAIIQKLHSIHDHDVSDAKDWEDDKLIRLVSKMNLEAKKDNPGVFENYDNLGASEFSGADQDVDASNTDAFNALMPAKI